ncbi:MAG: arylamine N-acetyltransferase [Anaerolineales bacterium]|nr:arylamine N-acetyltransferase [Anaerolineales bacterium]
MTLDVDAYLARLGYSGPRAPDTATLAGLHAAHLQSVPFENLDIGRGAPIVLDLDALYAKLITRRRGGFCYELNGMFAELLRALGYTVELLSARVWGRGEFGPEFDHLALRVTGGALAEPRLADVGFGGSFRSPLRLAPGVEQADVSGRYRLSVEDAVWRLEALEAGATKWGPSYTFTLRPRQFSDFAEMCVYQQTAPDSHFRQGPICSRATPDGRVSLSAGKLTFTTPGGRTELALPDPAAWNAALREHFGIVLESDPVFSGR